MRQAVLSWRRSPWGRARNTLSNVAEAAVKHFMTHAFPGTSLSAHPYTDIHVINKRLVYELESNAFRAGLYAALTIPE